PRGVTEHGGERDAGLDDLRAGAIFHVQNLAAPPAEIADHFAHELLRGDGLDIHNGLEQNRLGLFASFLERHRARDFEREFRRVHIVFLPVDHDSLDIDHRIAGDDAIFHRLFHAVFDRRNEVARDRSALGAVLEPEAPALGERLDSQLDHGELSVTAALANQLALGFSRALDRFAVRDLRLADIGVNFELAEHPI